MAKSLPELFQGFLRPLDSVSNGRIQDGFGEAVEQTQLIAVEARHERIRLLAADPDLGPLLRTLLRLRHDFVMLGRAAAEPLPDAIQRRLGPLLLRIAESVADHLRRSAAALAARLEPSPLEAAEAAFADCARTTRCARISATSIGACGMPRADDKSGRPSESPRGRKQPDSSGLVESEPDVCASRKARPILERGAHNRRTLRFSKAAMARIGSPAQQRPSTSAGDFRSAPDR
jgi:hypothetical protein